MPDDVRNNALIITGFIVPFYTVYSALKTAVVVSRKSSICKHGCISTDSNWLVDLWRFTEYSS